MVARVCVIQWLNRPCSANDAVRLVAKLSLYGGCSGKHRGVR